MTWGKYEVCSGRMLEGGCEKALGWGVKGSDEGRTPRAVRLSSSLSSSEAGASWERSSLELLRTRSDSEEDSSYSSWLLPATLADRGGSVTDRTGTSGRGIRLLEDLVRLSVDIIEEADACDDTSTHDSAMVERLARCTRGRLNSPSVYRRRRLEVASGASGCIDEVPSG
jgi:hypothetical protein